MVSKANKRRICLFVAALFLSQLALASPASSAPSSQTSATQQTQEQTQSQDQAQPQTLDETNNSASNVLPPSPNTAGQPNQYLDENSQQAAQEYVQSNQEMLGQVLYLASQLENKRNELLQTRGEKAVSDMIGDAQLIYVEPGLGKADYRLIKGDNGAPDVVITRVVLDSTEKAYLLVDQNQMPKGFYFRKYIAALLIEAGYRPQRDANGHVRTGIFGRQKMHYGRDTDLLIFNDNILNNVQTYKKPKPASWNWWRQYFWSKFSRPDKTTVGVALVFGAFPHTVETALMAHHMHTSMDPAYFGFAYSMLIGSYISTYKAWTNFGNSGARILKLMANATVFATSLVMLMKPGTIEEKLAGVSILNMTSILANVGMNSIARNKWNQISKIGDEARATTGQWKIPFTNIETWFKRSHAKNQLLYLIPWTINLVGIFILGSTHAFQIPHTGVTVPVLQFGGMPIAMVWSALYARHLANRAKSDPALSAHYQDLNKMANQYEHDWDRWVPQHIQIGTVMAYRSLSHKLRPAFRAASRAFYRCADLLTN